MEFSELKAIAVVLWHNAYWCGV